MNATNLINDLSNTATYNLNNGTSATGRAAMYFAPISGWISVDVTVDRIGRTRRNWYVRGYRTSIRKLRTLLASI